VSVDIVFIPLDYGVHAFERSAFFIGHPFYLFGVLNNDRPRTRCVLAPKMVF